MLRKVLCLTVILLGVSVALASAQSVLVMSDFNDMEGWTPASGDWEVDGNRLHQRSSSALMARVDHEIPDETVYEIRFNVRYEDGGYKSEQDLVNQIFHAGFGVHVGLANPLLGVESWGAGESYLLWLNLDTRGQTAEQYPDHFGLRAQVYESQGPVQMDLVTADWVERELGSEKLSIDIPAALRAAGIHLAISDVEPYLGHEIPMRIQVNNRTGTVRVADPTASVWYRLPLDANVLRAGDYLALRTNSLSVSFGDFRIVSAN